MRQLLGNAANRDLALAFAAGTAMLLASLANFLTHNDYPYFRPEIGLVLLGVLALMGVMAAWYVLQRQWGRSFLEGLLAALFIDLNTDFYKLAIAAGLAVAAFTAWRRMSLLGPMAILGTVVFLTTLAGLGGRPAWIQSVKGDASGKMDPAKPAMVHIILDEHLGLEGLASEGAEGVKVRDELSAAYQAAGFAVYGGAYSQHYHSANAIPFILNYGKRLGHRVGRRGVRTGPTEHLASLVDQGYRLTILQSDYVDLCTNARFHECTTYDSSSVRPTLSVPMAVQDRAGLIATKFARMSFIADRVGRIWNFAAKHAHSAGLDWPPFTWSSSHSSTVGGLEAAPILLDRVKAARPGDAVFAHLLVPHHPYVVGRDCRYVPRPWHGMMTRAPIEHRRLAYYEQLRCTERLIGAVVAALAKSPAGSNSLLIIHGDHGSRLVRHEPYEMNKAKLSDTDLIAGFSAMFAVRGNGIAPAYNNRPQPVAALLGELANAGFKIAPAGNSPVLPLVLDDWALRPRSNVPLPASWTKRLDRPGLAQ